MKYLLIALLLTGCAGLPDLSLTPVSAALKIGGTHETGTAEDNMVKVNTGDTSTVDYTAELVQQTYTDIQEYPTWLILSFALAVGFALPSPFGAYSNWRQRRRLEKHVTLLTNLLAQSQPQPNKEPSHGSTTDSNIITAS
mgnify:CR=1 FL=1